MILHFLEALAVVAVCSSLTVCGLMIFERGRAFLRKLGRTISGDPVDAVVVFLFVTVAVAIGGSKPEPPPVVTEEGIRLTRCVQTPRRVSFAWESDDPRIGTDADYLVQEWVPEFGWHTIATTKERAYEHKKFTIEKMRRYRIAVDITEKTEGKQ